MAFPAADCLYCIFSEVTLEFKQSWLWWEKTDTMLREESDVITQGQATDSSLLSQERLQTKVGALTSTQHSPMASCEL